MSQAPCTLFWPRSGFTPTPGAADIAGRHGEVGDRHDRGRALAVLGDAEAVIDRAIAAGGVEPRRAADVFGGRRRTAFRPPPGCAAARTRRRPVLELAPVAALADELLVEQPFGDDRHAPAPSRTATLVPGFSGRWYSASTCGERTMSVRRGSSTISLAPLRSRFFSREANTGWPSVGLAPMIMTTSVCSTESKSCVPAEVPKVWPRP